MSASCAAIIVAAGSSQRAGFDKLMARLGDDTVLGASFHVFHACPRIGEIVLVTTRERFNTVVPRPENCRIPVHCVPGGAERHLSVIAGLNALKTSPDIVAVHDGARPLLHPEQLLRCLEEAEKHGAAASAHPVVDTLKMAGADGLTLPVPVDRSFMWGMETPQVFSLPLIREAYQEVLARNLLVTDEVSALEAIGKATCLVQNKWPNIKITMPQDLAVAEQLWENLITGEP